MSNNLHEKWKRYMRIAIVTGASSGLDVEFTKTIINKYKDLDEIWIVASKKKDWLKLQMSIRMK